MRVLCIDVNAQASIDAAVTHATRPENLMTSTDDWMIGDRSPHSVCLFNKILCWYSINFNPATGVRCRQLSVSKLPPPGRPPRLEIVVEIARAFGFSGYEPGFLPPWDIGPCPQGCCAIVEQTLDVAAA